MAMDSQPGMILIQTTTVFAMKKREMLIQMEIRSPISSKQMMTETVD